MDSSLCTVLGYHEVGPVLANMQTRYNVTPAAFESQLAYLHGAGSICVSLEDLGRALAGTLILPPRSFVITFDDGYVGVFRHALPILRSFAYTATVFVSSRLIGETGGGAVAPHAEKMNESQLRHLLAAGHSIGSHTRTHASLPDHSVEMQWDEIHGCKDDLEHLFERPIDTFCYPYGRYDSEIADLVRDAGYTLACTVKSGVVTRDADPYQIPRLMVREHTDLQESLDWQ